MTILISSNFDGANGSSWPAPWSTALYGGTTGGAIDVQSNRGRVRTHDGSYRAARADAVGVNFVDGVIEATVRFPAVTEHYLYLWARSGVSWNSSSNAYKDNGYCIILRAVNNGTSMFAVQRFEGGSHTVLSSVSLPSGYAVNVDYRVKFEIVGNILRAKFWAPDSGSEPDWMLNAADTVHTSGQVALSFMSGDASGTREVLLDNISVTRIGEETPEGLAAQQKQLVKLEWNDSAGTVFDVRKNGETIVATGLPGSPYFDSDIIVGETVFYEVRQDGSDWSEPQHQTIEDYITAGMKFLRRRTDGSGWGPAS